MHTSRHKGITLIETLLVVVLGTIVTGFVALSFSKVDEHEALETGADTVVSVLSEARSLTLSAAADTRYGVHFDTDQVVLFRGATYSSSASTNVPTQLNAKVGLRNIALTGGGSNVVFNRLTGATSHSGSFEIYLKSATSTYRTINISATGVSERN